MTRFCYSRGRIDSYKNDFLFISGMENIKKIMDDLVLVKGLANIYILNKKDKKAIKMLEESRNIGVLEAIKKPCTLVLTHDSSFRQPTCPIVANDSFPPVPFPEVKAKSVVSSSPGKKVHNYLVDRFKLNLDNKEATLLIGFKL